MKLNIDIETLTDDYLAVPIDSSEGLQIRHDGVKLDGKLILWEEIMYIGIRNRGLLKSLKQRR